jgi:hypothetical protein
MTRNDSPQVLTGIARSGYVARGVVNALVGFLIIWAVAHGSGASPSSSGALATLLEAPLGRPALYAVALGLLCYSAWRFVQAVGDADHQGRDAKGLTARGVMVISGVIHLSLAWSALAIAGLDLADGAGGDGSTDRTAMLMQQPFGRWLVGLLGSAVVVGGIVQMWRGYKATFMEHLTVDRTRLGALYPISRLGLFARGSVFLILGGLLIRSALNHDGSQETGMHAAFDQIVVQPYGIALLGIAGAGMLCFAAYGILVQGRFRRVDM